jgi:5-methylcytosine-specific restriction protein A
VSSARGASRRTKAVNPFYKSKAWMKARAQVLKRDHYRCVQCGANVRPKGAARIDHILPRKKFPDLSLHIPNLRTLCVPCDNARHARDRAARKDEAPAIGPDGFPLDGSWS